MVQRHALLTPPPLIYDATAAVTCTADPVAGRPAAPPHSHSDNFTTDCIDGVDGADSTADVPVDGEGSTEGTAAMECVDGNSVWQHMLTCFDTGCPDPLCRGGKAILRHRLTCEVRSRGIAHLSIAVHDPVGHYPSPSFSLHVCLWQRAQDPACLRCELICSRFKTRPPPPSTSRQPAWLPLQPLAQDGVWAPTAVINYVPSAEDPARAAFSPGLGLKPF